jgi:hypothetical protein
MRGSRLIDRLAEGMWRGSCLTCCTISEAVDGRQILRYCGVTMAKKRAESREGMIVTTVALPPDLHRRLAMAALEDNAASAELIRQAIEEWLSRRKRPKGAK